MPTVREVGHSRQDYLKNWYNLWGQVRSPCELSSEFEGNMGGLAKSDELAIQQRYKISLFEGRRNLSIVDEKRPDESLQGIEKRKLSGWHEGCLGKALGGDVYDKRDTVHSGCNLHVVDVCITFRNA